MYEINKTHCQKAPYAINIKKMISSQSYTFVLPFKVRFVGVFLLIETTIIRYDKIPFSNDFPPKFGLIYVLS